MGARGRLEGECGGPVVPPCLTSEVGELVGERLGLDRGALEGDPGVFDAVPSGEEIRLEKVAD